MVYDDHTTHIGGECGDDSGAVGRQGKAVLDMVRAVGTVCKAH